MLHAQFVASFSKNLERFARQERLTPQQHEQFEQYLITLHTWNQRMNLTAVDVPEDIITYHFEDSLAVRPWVDFSKISTVVDIGTGAGFPGLPLKICFPHLNVVLIEVVQKKVQFLEAVIQELKLENVEVFTQDWRTFLRTTDYAVDYALTRAALKPVELLRMFKPGCHYAQAKLVYWASNQWQPTPEELPFITQHQEYHVGDRERKLVFFSKP